MNAQSVNIAFDVWAERSINHSVPRYAATSVELLRHNSDIKVPFAFPGAGVPGMQVALVFDQQLGRLERRHQQALNFCNAFGSHGSTGLKGLTLTLA